MGQNIDQTKRDDTFLTHAKQFEGECMTLVVGYKSTVKSQAVDPSTIHST